MNVNASWLFYTAPWRLNPCVRSEEGCCVVSDISCQSCCHAFPPRREKWDWRKVRWSKERRVEWRREESLNTQQVKKKRKKEKEERGGRGRGEDKVEEEEEEEEKMRKYTTRTTSKKMKKQQPGFEVKIWSSDNNPDHNFPNVRSIFWTLNPWVQVSPVVPQSPSRLTNPTSKVNECQPIRGWRLMPSWWTWCCGLMDRDVSDWSVDSMRGKNHNLLVSIFSGKFPEPWTQCCFF